MKKKLKAVLFDMDGVLFNSMPYHSEAWHQVMKTHGLDLSREEAYMHEGRTGASTINIVSTRQRHREATEEEIKEMFLQESISTDLLLKWSKLLEYDFFRLYTQHLILYAPPVKQEENENNKKSSLPQFRKNIYTKEIIDFILEQISNGKMTKNEVIERYRIPKTTLYKWISKYSEIK